MAMIGKFSHYSFMNANVFSAMQSRLSNRSNEVLAEEERQDKSNGLTNIAALMRANNVRVSDSLNNIEDSVAVIFNDPKTNQRITLNLSSENLNKLKGQFDSSNFYAREDGAIRLNGKAEAFVSGWFGDIAYQQNYVAADVDKSGRIDDEELRETKTFAVSGIYNLQKDIAKDFAIETYVTIGNNPTIELETGYDDRTIEGLLNSTIKLDKNFDGHIERIGELYEGGIMDLIQELDEVFEKAEKNVLYSISEPLVSDNTNFNQPMTQSDWKKKLEKLKKLREELDEQFAERAEKAKEQLEQISQKEIKDIDSGLKQSAIDSDLESKETHQIQTEKSLDFDNPELSPVVDEIRSKIASNDVQLFEVRA